MDKQLYEAAIAFAVDNDVSFQDAANYLRFTGRSYESPVRFQRMNLPSLNAPADEPPAPTPGLGAEPPRAVGPYGKGQRMAKEADPGDYNDDSLDMDTLTGDPDFARRAADQVTDPDHMSGPRVRVYMDKNPAGDIVLTEQGVEAEAEDDAGRQLVEGLIRTHRVTDLNGLRRLPQLVSESRQRGLKAVFLGDAGSEGDDYDDESLGDDQTDDQTDDDGGPALDDNDSVNTAEDEDEEQPVRMSRRYFRDGDRLIWTRPVW